MDDDHETQPFPHEIADTVRRSSLDEDELVQVVWSELELENLGRPFSLPLAPDDSGYASFGAFVEIEMKLQAEIMREDLNKKVERNSFPPKEATEDGRKAEKHLRFPLPNHLDSTSQTLSFDLNSVHREPSRGMFTNYVMVLQTKQHVVFI